LSRLATVRCAFICVASIIRRGDAGHATTGRHVVKAKFILGGLEAVIDCPAMAFDGDEGLDARASRAPCREEGEIAITDIATDQQTTGPTF